MGKWDSRRAKITLMVHAEMTDAEIGSEYGVSAQTIFHVRKQFGIPSNRRRKGNPYQKNLDTLNAPEPLVGVPYVDPVTGLTVTRYPARYAAGADVQVVTARPRR